MVVRTAEPPELGPGPRPGVLPAHALERQLRDWAEPREIPLETLRLVRAAALLYQDQHDAAHDLVQDGSDADTALIHAILHRREPDFWNAKYWFRRASDHAVYRVLSERGWSLAMDDASKRTWQTLTLAGIVDPFRFVDEIENVSHARSKSPESDFLRRLQQVEFQVLFEYLLDGLPSR